MLSSSTSFPSRLTSKLISMSRFEKIGMMLATDLVLLPFCFVIALLLRVGRADFVLHYSALPCFLTITCTIAVFALTGLYGAIIRFIDLRLLMGTGIGLAVGVATSY